MWEAPLLRWRMSVFLWGNSAHWFITAWCVKGSFLFSLFNKGRALNLLSVCMHPSVYWVQLSFFQSILLCYSITSAFLLWIVVVLMHNLEPSLCYPIRPVVNMMLSPLPLSFHFSHNVGIIWSPFTAREILLDLICCKVVLVCWEACWTECQIVTLTLAPVVEQQISGLKLIGWDSDALAACLL